MSETTHLPAAAIVVHDRAQAEAALAVAEALGVPVMLWSPPGAAAFVGAAYFQAMLADALGKHPDVEVTSVLDCGERAGDALGALRQGIEAVCFHGPPELADKLRDMAGQQGAIVLEARPEALDLAAAGDAESACRKWLERTETSDK